MSDFVKKNAVYALERKDKSAELTMYGDIVENQPYDWWTGEPSPGNYITLDGFMEDLETLKGCKTITIRMNSYGGDAGVSTTIHNRLRALAREGAEITCIVDGVAMSGGSLIMCAADKVQVNPSSLVMIHKCWSMIWGAYNADELRQLATSNDAYDKAQVAIYQRKTGLDARKLEGMMADTTYLTGKEAVSLGFADELLEGAEPLQVAASADGRSLYCRGRRIDLPTGVFAPDHIQTITASATACNTTPAPAGKGNKPDDPAGEPEGDTKEVKSMTKEELMEQYPELVEQIGADAKATVDAEEIARKAVEAERERMAGIDAVANLFDEEMVKEARYGEKACDARELSYRAAQKAAQQGRSFLASLEEDSEESGVNKVPAAQSGEEEETPASVMEAGRKAMKAALGG